MSGGYVMYLDDMEMPVTPGKLELKIKGKNKTITLVNDGEVNFLKHPGLTEITVTLLFPMLEEYGDIRYSRPDVYLSNFERIMTERRPARFIMSRAAPNGFPLFDTNIKVSIESYTIDEDATNGLDVYVTLMLKQYVDFGAKTVKVTPETGTATVEQPRPEGNPPNAKTHKVAAGDTLWALAKKYYGDGSLYMKIFEANRDKISNPNLIYTGQELTIPELSASAAAPSAAPINAPLAVLDEGTGTWKYDQVTMDS
ncbi:MAG: LysM peptidoglycan-binding domain-containing protein [Oscillospiraceae bacterium]|jgi:LysM repeat protein|nr:LysM peptidoglycan-binding domain-containing protein [Oscillospiraceae bacterium]